MRANKRATPACTYYMLICLQFKEMVCEYDSKHAVYFKLHQEIQDTRVKVEGLQQVLSNARLSLYLSVLSVHCTCQHCCYCIAGIWFTVDLLKHNAISHVAHDVAMPSQRLI